MTALPPEPRRGVSEHVRWIGAELIVCLGFYTRLSLGPSWLAAAHPPDPFSRALRWAPVAGAVVGLCGAAVLVAARAAGLPASVAGTLAIATTVLASGALHEDGLGDVADGFGGGKSIEGKLDIMRDSRIGAYGAVAILVSVLLRAQCLSALLERDGPLSAAAALVTAGAVARWLGLLPLAALRPARTDGLARAAGELAWPTFAWACVLATPIGLGLPALAGTGLARSCAALLLSAIAAAGASRLAWRQIGGHTGDVAGAAEQLCEIAFLLGLLTSSGLE